MKKKLSHLFYTLIPRPWDLFAKGLYFWYGYLFGLFILNKGSHDNSYFLQYSLFTSTSYLSKLPAASQLIVFGLIFYTIEEILLQQAKLLWDDIYDIERDKKLPLNTARALSSGRISLESAKLNISIRLFFAFYFGYLLGGSLIIAIFSLILFHQGIYIFWGKPIIQKRPLLVLSVLSLNTFLRFLAGISIISNHPKIAFLTLITATVIYLQSFSSLSFFWRVEGDYLMNNGMSNFIRPQSHYFLQNGKKIQIISLILVDLIILITLFAGHLIDDSRWLIGLQAFVNFPLLILLFLLTYTIIILLKGPQQNKNLNRLFSIFTKYFSLAMICLFFLALMNSDAEIALFAYLLYNLALMLAYENMDFLDYTFARAKAQINFLFAKLHLSLSKLF